MFNFLKKIDKENRIGVLKSLDIDNISNGKCFVCSKRINIESLFRNSLVVKDTFITVECLRCRSKGEYSLDTKPEEKLNNDFMIYFADDQSEQVKKVIAYIDHIYPSRLDLLFAIRLGTFFKGYAIGYFYQKGFTQSDRRITTKEYHRFLHFDLQSQRRRFNDFYGKLFSINECGECGHLWSPHNQEERNQLHLKIETDKKCPNCHIPNNMQWNMRTDLKAEILNLHIDSLRF